MADLHALVTQLDEQFENSTHYDKNRTFTETISLVKASAEAYEDHMMVPMPAVMFDMFRSLLAHVEDLEGTLEVQDVTRIEGQ